MFSYGEMEAMLVRAHGIDSASTLEVGGASFLGAFKARIRHLQRLGIPIGLKPGKGKKNEYSREHLYQMALCLEFAEAGFAPGWSVAMVKFWWTRFFHNQFLTAGKQVSEGAPDWIVFVPARALTSTGQDDEGRTGYHATVPSAGDEADVPDFVATLKGNERRGSLINLSETVRLLRAAEQEIHNSNRLLQEV